MLKIAPPVKCSGKHCDKILSFGSYKGNLCQQCMSRLRRRSSITTANTSSHEIDVKVEPVTVVSGTPSPPLPANEEPTSPMNSEGTSSSPTRFNAPKFIGLRLNRPQRLSFVIPHQPSRTCCIPSSVKATRLHELPAVHFNSRGEHLDFATCEPSGKSVLLEGSSVERASRDLSTKTTCTTSMIIPVNTHPLPTSPIRYGDTLVPTNATDDEDIDMGDIELSYPYPELPDVNMANQNSFPSPQLETSRLFPSDTHDLVDNPVPKKRLKVSHPEVIDLTTPLPETSTSEEPVQASPVEANKQNHGTSRSLKLCSTASCTGNVSAESSATRCLDCVRHDWNLRKSKLSFTRNQRTSTNNANGVPGKELVKKKGVTWADEMPSGADNDKNWKATINSAPLRISLSRSAISDIGSKEIKLPVSKYPTTSGSPARKRSISISSVQIDRPSDDCSKTQSIPKLRLRRTSTSSDHGLGAHKESGWDSDLTDLSDSTGDRDSAKGLLSESESHITYPPLQSSGLTIRIPPRPGGVHIRQCGSHGCNQLLEPEYRWKSCVICRARSRDYQRKRQNLQGRHVRLDQELQAQKLGTPLSGDFYKETQKEQDGDVSLVPGARLCSIRNCTFIIPPVEEYRWKMCSLCRLCRKEKNRQDKYNASESLSTVEGELKERAPRLIVLKALKNLPLRSGPCPPNRCRSVDCGMVTKPKSLQCKQCSGRHRWLLARSGTNIQLPLHSRQYTDTPRQPTPYSQFQCFSTLLFEFKNLLSAFLQVQSIYFLFKRLKNANAMFAFDGEFSTVAPDFDLISRQEGIDADAQKYKREIEHVGRIKFKPRRLISILEGGGVAVRFVCQYTVPILQTVERDDKSNISTTTRNMQCELEVANLPDHSHPFIPGQRTIIRFRLLG